MELFIHNGGIWVSYIILQTTSSHGFSANMFAIYNEGSVGLTLRNRDLLFSDLCRTIDRR